MAFALNDPLGIFPRQAIEQGVRELDANARQALRQTKAKPVLKDLKTWSLE